MAYMTLVMKRKATLDASLLASQQFAQVFQAYLECSDEIQAAINDMVEIANDPESTEDDQFAALSTIADALFPESKNGILGDDLIFPDDDPEITKLLDRLDKKEAAFAERVTELLKAKNITQTDLAATVGIGQPAISMMLSRESRPQHRTVVKIAKALQVDPEELWPGISDG
jgi:DNA-binding phage protein